MSFSKLYYGTSNPEELTKENRILIHVISFSVITSIYAYWCDFIPSAQFIKFGFILSTSFWAFFIYKFCKWHRSKKLIIKENKILSKELTVTLMSIIFLITSYMSVVHALPAIYTKFFGQDNEYFIKVKKSKKPHSRLCEYRVKSNVFDNALPSYVCVDKNFYNEIFGDRKIKIKTKRSFLGEYVENIFVYRRRDE